MVPLTALLYETAAKVALLVAVFALAGLSYRGPAKSRQELQAAALTLSLMLPFFVLILPRWAVIDLSWLAPQSAPTRDMASGVAAQSSDMVFVWLWLAGLVPLLVRELFSQAALVRWERRSSKALSPNWRGAVEAAAHQFPKLRTVTVLESAEVFSPCTWGIVRPVLLLPTIGSAWNESERRLALLHELAHIRRFDCLSDLIGRLACAVHWYNPLVWWTAAQSRRLQEHACDDHVLLSGARASDYARFLLSLGVQSATVRGAAGMAGASPIGGRVRAVLQAKACRTAASPWRFLSVLCVLSAAGLVLASLSPIARAQSVASAGGHTVKHHAGPTSEQGAAAPQRLLGGRGGERAAQPSDRQNIEQTGSQRIELASVFAPASEAAPAVPATPPTPVIAPIAPTPATPVSERPPHRASSAHPP